jgi:hypothetical protein
MTDYEHDSTRFEEARRQLGAALEKAATEPQKD